MNRDANAALRSVRPGQTPTANQPLVTVVMCVYNAGQFLRPALLSVVSQTYRNLEILIIDDGSTDGCMETIADVADPRIRIIRQANAGKPATLNRAMDQLRGEFFAIQDADDLSHPHRIERQVQAMIENPELGAVFCGYELVLDHRRVAPTFSPRSIEQCRGDVEAFRMPAHDATAMFRVSAVRGLRYDPTLTLGEGRDFILQVGEQHPLLVVGECLYGYRIHSDSITVREEHRRAHYDARVIRRACERRGCPTPNGSVGSRRRSTTKHRTLVAHFMESVVNLRQAGQHREAWQTALTCARLRPTSVYYHRPLVYALAPLKLITCYRNRKTRAH